MRIRLPAKPCKEQETVQRLLDAAEKLFGEHGYDGVGMRMLAKEAKVNLGAATYHFGSKESLYLETFMRRFRPTNAERLRLLQEAEAAANGKPLAVEKIVECMIRPPFESGFKYPAFHIFLARNLFMPPSFFHTAIQKEMEPDMMVFIAALCRSLPNVPEDLVHLRTMFSMGALLMFSTQVGKMTTGKNMELKESLLQELVRFMSTGLESKPAVPAANRPPIPRPPKPPRR